MMKRVDTLRKLQAYKSCINQLFENNGKIYFHHIKSLEAMMKQKKADQFVILLDEDQQILSAFEITENQVWQCCFNALPIVFAKKNSNTHIQKFLMGAQEELHANALYFPLVYKVDSNQDIFDTSFNYHEWSRLPNPIVSPPLDPKVMWERVISRYGHRAARQRKKFIQELSIKIFSGQNVRNLIERVELHSWKHRFNQDMLSRDNQIVYYSAIIESGLASITFAFDSELPVAYRIDVKVNNVLFTLKWSFDESFKKYSPGFSLLTWQLFEQYSRQSLHYIDLYGSPDQLKKLLETSRIDRFDVCVSKESSIAESIKKRKIKYDAKIASNFQKSYSITKLFE